MFDNGEVEKLKKYLIQNHDLYLNLFKGRNDASAERWEYTGKDGKKKTGYRTICKNKMNFLCPKTKDKKYPCAQCSQKNYTGVTQQLLEKHFNGLIHLGCYPLLDDNTTWFVAADFDDHDPDKKRTPLDDVKRFVAVADKYGIPVYVLSSRSGKGYHVYTFFESSVSAALARSAYLGMLVEAGIDVSRKNDDSYDRLFPSQVKHTGSGYGNLIGMPFQGQAIHDSCTVFVDLEIGQAISVDEQIKMLGNIERISAKEFERLPKHEYDNNSEPPDKTKETDANFARFTQFIVPRIIALGGRNETIFKLTCSLHSKGLDESTLRTVIHAENTSKCNPPLETFEVDAIITSVISRYPQGQAHGSSTYNLTDLGNAERFVARHGEKVRYSSERKQWLVWDGKRFQEDFLGEVQQMAYFTVRSIYSEASSANSKDVRQALSKHANASENGHRIEQMVKLARNQSGIPIRQEQLDADPWLINCQNGILDLKTLKLEKHDPNRLITKIARTYYDETAYSPLWDSFLKRIFNDNQTLITYLQKIVGVALTGKTLQAVFILHGIGANGKSTFLEVIRRLLGDYAQQADFNTFIEQKNQTIREDLASLCGARCVMASESDNGKYLSEALVKQITGGEAIRSRFLYGRSFEYVPTFNIFLATNHKPNVQGTDHGIWRRLKLVPFDVTIPEGERDENLLEKLLEELPGIFAWAVDGCNMWQEDGLDEPEEVKAATRAYREDNDVLNDFINDRLEFSSEFKEDQKDTYLEYVRWCDENGVKKPFSKQAFNSKMRERGWKHKHSGGNFWLGVRIKQETFGDDMLPEEMNPFE
jgi:putative DNA primase/helicase